MTPWGECIVFMQGDDYAEFETVLDRSGEAAALAYLVQWDYGEGGSPEATQPGQNWHEHTCRSGEYLMMWSARHGYCGLYRSEADA